MEPPMIDQDALANVTRNLLDRYGAVPVMLAVESIRNRLETDGSYFVEIPSVPGTRECIDSILAALGLDPPSPCIRVPGGEA